MRQRDRIDAYVAEVCRQIRWKRARGAVGSEIRNHIHDQIDAYAADGKNEDLATELAIRDMGDPVVAGVLLDRVHRPKADWPLLALTAVMIVFGIILHIISIGAVSRTIYASEITVMSREFLLSFAPAAAALAVFLLVYFLDFSRTGWIPSAVYLCLAALIPILFALAGAANHRVAYYPFFNSPAPYYLQYLFLPVPVAVSVLIYRLALKGYTGLVLSLLLFIASAAAAYLIANMAMAVIISAAGLAVLTRAVAKGHFSVKKGIGFTLVWAPAAVTVLVFIRTIVARIQSVLVLGSDPMNNYGLRYTIAKAGFAKGATIVAGQDFDYRKLPYTDDTNMLNYLIVRFGWIIFILIAVLVTLYAVLLIRNCLRQHSRLGQLVSVAVTTILLAQAIIYIAANLGFMLFVPLTLPLLTHGGFYLILDVGLIGILLSMYRTDGLTRSGISISQNRTEAPDTEKAAVLR